MVSVKLLWNCDSSGCYQQQNVQLKPSVCLVVKVCSDRSHCHLQTFHRLQSVFIHPKQTIYLSKGVSVCMFAVMNVTLVHLLRYCT